LMELIARDVVQKPDSLVGTEVRFLRKRLSKKAQDFSKDIGIEPETLSRIENDKQQAKESTDKLIRLYYAVSSGDPVLLDELKKALGELLRHWTNVHSNKKLVAKVTDNEWEAEAVAA
jgi:transcriptional regulator with XRE-family HTH domain